MRFVSAVARVVLSVGDAVGVGDADTIGDCATLVAEEWVVGDAGTVDGTVGLAVAVGGVVVFVTEEWVVGDAGELETFVAAVAVAGAAFVVTGAGVLGAVEGDGEAVPELDVIVVDVEPDVFVAAGVAGADGVAADAVELVGEGGTGVDVAEEPVEEEIVWVPTGVGADVGPSAEAGTVTNAFQMKIAMKMQRTFMILAPTTYISPYA